PALQHLLGALPRRVGVLDLHDQPQGVVEHQTVLREFRVEQEFAGRRDGQMRLSAARPAEQVQPPHRVVLAGPPYRVQPFADGLDRGRAALRGVVGVERRAAVLPDVDPGTLEDLEDRRLPGLAAADPRLLIFAPLALLHLGALRLDAWSADTL